MLIVLIVPLYLNTYKNIKQRIIQEYLSKMEMGIRRLDFEMEIYQTIKQKMSNDTHYIRLKNLEKFDSSKQYSYLMEFTEYYQGQIKWNTLMSDSYIFFRNNNVAVSNNYQFDNIEPFFQYYINLDGMNYSQFREKIFNEALEFHLEYKENLSLKEEETDAIVVYVPIRQYIKNPPDAVIICFYRIQDLFEHMGISEYKQVFDYIALNDSIIYSNGKTPIAKGDSLICSGQKMNLTFKMSISKKYLLMHMRFFIVFVIIYFLLLLLVALFLEAVTLNILNKPLHNMVSMVESITGEKCKSHSGLQYLYHTVWKLRNENLYWDQTYNNITFNMLFLKELDDEECELFRKKHPNFSEPFLFVMFSGKYLMPEVLRLCLQQHNMNSNFLVEDPRKRLILFLNYNDELDIENLKNNLNSVLFDFKKHKVELVSSISTPCESLKDFYNAYRHVNHRNRFVDHSTIIDMSECKTEQKDAVKFDDMSLLYDYIIQGDAFNAKKCIYMQWYEIMENNSDEDMIKKLYFKQIDVLTDIASQINYKEEFAQYDENKKIDELAFSIEKSVDKICELINLKKQRDSNNEVLKYLDENFNKVDFGLIDVEERFGICGKTINKIIKEHYGKTFSDYIEEKRLRLAKTLLEQTDKGMSEVALQCGFANYITFYKFFRKHTGTSPNNFRQARIAERNIISNCN